MAYNEEKLARLKHLKQLAQKAKAESDAVATRVKALEDAGAQANKIESIYRDQKNKLMPYAAKNNGLFEVKERTGRHNDWAGTQTLITPKGRETFRLLCKEPPVLPQFTAL